MTVPKFVAAGLEPVPVIPAHAVTIQVEAITVISRKMTDKVCLTLRGATTAFPSIPNNDPPGAIVDVQHGHGVDWARKNFPGVLIDVVNESTGERVTFSG